MISTIILFPFSKVGYIYFDTLQNKFTSRTDKVIEHGLHIDIENSLNCCKTSVMYLNTNNGYTLFEDGTKVDSVANRLVTFNNSTKHSGIRKYL